MDPRISGLRKAEIKDYLYQLDRSIVIPNSIKLADLQALATKRLASVPKEPTAVTFERLRQLRRNSTALALQTPTESPPNQDPTRLLSSVNSSSGEAQKRSRSKRPSLPNLEDPTLPSKTIPVVTRTPHGAKVSPVKESTPRIPELPKRLKVTSKDKPVKKQVEVRVEELTLHTAEPTKRVKATSKTKLVKFTETPAKETTPRTAEPTKRVKVASKDESVKFVETPVEESTSHIAAPPERIKIISEDKLIKVTETPEARE